MIQAEGIHPDIVVANKKPAGEEKPLEFLREKDLKQHLEIKNGEGPGEAEEGKQPEAGADPGAGPAKAQDDQLEQAVGILRSWDIFLKMQNGTRPPATESSKP